MTPEPVWPVAALLGEGPAWFPDEGLLRFVDIKQGRIHRHDPATGVCTTIELGGQPSFVVPTSDGGLLVGNGTKLQHASAGGYGPVVAQIAMPGHNRTNDSTVDGAGRLWFGTMDDDETRATGGLYCLDRGRLHSLGQKAVVTNGPAATADGRMLYFVHSGERTNWRLTLGDGPTITRREVFLQLTKADGHPDGIVLDSEDCLWVALWDGWGLRRYAPDGSLLAHIPFPCARVTKLAFGGPDLRTGFVTTARIGLDETALAAQPLAGALFAFQSPVAGRVLPPVALE